MISLKLPPNSASDVFGQDVQTDPTLPHFARNLIAPRNINCPECGAYMWIHEKVGGTKAKPEFNICCARGTYFNL